MRELYRTGAEDWACLVGRPWPIVATPARARRYALRVRKNVVVDATQTSSGDLDQTDALRHLKALAQCVDALGRCEVDLDRASVVAWVDDELSGTRDRPLAHLCDYEALPAPAAPDDDAAQTAALVAALTDGPALSYRARADAE